MLMVLPCSAAPGSAAWGADLVAQTGSTAQGSAAGVGAFLSAASPVTYGPGGSAPQFPGDGQAGSGFDAHQVLALFKTDMDVDVDNSTTYNQQIS